MHLSLCSEMEFLNLVRSNMMPTPKDINDKQEQLESHRRTLAQLLLQQAKFGNVYVPPHVVNDIANTRENIQRIKSILEGWGISVSNHPDDVALPTRPRIF